MKFCTYIFFVIVSCYILKAEIDTNIVYRTSQVNVISERILSHKEFEIATSRIITKSEIERTNFFQVSEVISKSPGVYIKNYGGLGGLKTISIRGTSSTQSVIAFDGIVLNSMQNGSYDLSGIPLTLINKVEIVRSGNSSFFGSNAIAGAVNFLTEINQNKTIELYSKYSSIDELQTSTIYNFEIKKIKNAINFDWTRSSGEYPFQFKQFGETKQIKRKNADYQNFSFAYNNEYVNNSLILKNNLITEFSQRGVPGAVLQGRIEATKARLDENKLFFKTGLDILLKNNIMLEIDGAYKFSYLNYKDPELPNFDQFGTDNNYYSNDLVFQSKFSFTDLSYELNFKLGINYSQLRGDMLDRAVEGRVSRLNPNLAASYSHKESNFLGNLLTNCSIRIDFFDDGHPAISPTVGLRYDFEYLSLKIVNSYNFRKPNFNEMYYFNFGTRELKPERSLNSTIGIVSNIFDNLSIELNGFIISTRDQIIAVPKSPISWSASNIEKVAQKGLEFSLEGNFKPIRLDNLTFNWTLQQALNKTKHSYYYNKQIPLTPQELINGFLIFNFDYFKLNIDFDYTSFRYIDPENNKRWILPEYYLLNVGINFPIEYNKLKFSLQFDVKNLSNKQYEIIPNYPMPRRQFIMGMKFEY